MADYTIPPAMANEQAGLGSRSSSPPETITTRGPHDAGFRATPYSSSRPPSRGSTTSVSSRTDMLAPQHSAGFMTPRSAASSGFGPQRHRRPLNTAELHHQLETEQEATVNRLSRELSILRARQAATILSIADSASACRPGCPASLMMATPAEYTSATAALGPMISSVNVAGVTTAAAGSSGITPPRYNRHHPASLPSFSAAPSPTVATFASASTRTPAFSRKNSVASSRRSVESFPALRPIISSSGGASPSHDNMGPRHVRRSRESDLASLPSSRSVSPRLGAAIIAAARQVARKRGSSAGSIGPDVAGNPSRTIAMGGYDPDYTMLFEDLLRESERERLKGEWFKRENEMLKMRIRELEGVTQGREESIGDLPPKDSNSSRE